jgi:hypothetical protein
VQPRRQSKGHTKGHATTATTKRSTKATNSNASAAAASSASSSASSSPLAPPSPPPPIDQLTIRHLLVTDILIGFGSTVSLKWARQQLEERLQLPEGRLKVRSVRLYSLLLVDL